MLNFEEVCLMIKNVFLKMWIRIPEIFFSHKRDGGRLPFFFSQTDQEYMGGVEILTHFALVFVLTFAYEGPKK